MRLPPWMVLILANLLPIAQVLFFGWQLFDLLFLYWLESAVIGCFHIGKIIKVSHWVVQFFAVPFFIIHYGTFMCVHLIFLFALFAGPAPFDPEAFPPSGESLQALFGSAVVPFIGLWISHGTSYVQNFLGNKEYRTMDPRTLFFAPYRRIVFMHGVILLGGVILTLVKRPAIGLVLLCVAKTLVDLHAHRMEHRSARSPAAASDA